MFEGEERYADNELKKWIGTHGPATSQACSKGKVSP